MTFVGRRNPSRRSVICALNDRDEVYYSHPGPIHTSGSDSQLPWVTRTPQTVVEEFWEFPPRVLTCSSAIGFDGCLGLVRV